jgi:predicted nucleic acid-binding protein
MIVADTGAIIALLDRSERNHAAVRELYEDDPESWVLPSAILPEVDYLVATHLGAKARDAFLEDLAEGAFAVEWGNDRDLTAAVELHRKYRALDLGLVDAVVMAMAVRLRAEAIATLDIKHFGAVTLATRPKLLPRDRPRR